LATDAGGIYVGRSESAEGDGLSVETAKTLTIPDEAKKIAWKAQQRLHKRHPAFATEARTGKRIMNEHWTAAQMAG
jgi:hypothetical protein